jgi:DNA-binding transcriptional ArsR family regulator
MPPPSLPYSKFDPALDRVWKALASDVRREILDLLRERPMTTGEIVMCFPDLSRFAVMQHMKVLARANLLITRKDAGEDGRERHHFLNVVPIQQIYERWVRNYEGLWAGMLTGLKAGLEGGLVSGPVGGSGARGGALDPTRAKKSSTASRMGEALNELDASLHELRRERRAGRGGGERA